MASVSSTFTAVGVSATLFVKKNEKFRLTISNTWVGAVRVEESRNNGISYEQVDQFTANFAQDVAAKTFNRLIRLTMAAYTSGTLTYVFANVTSVLTRCKHTTVPVGAVAYGSVGTSTTPSATTLYLIELFVDAPFTVTGIGMLNGGTAATDKYIYALYDTAGLLLANSAVAGVVAANADTFQEIVLGTPAPFVIPAGRYWIGVFVNGTTTRIRTVATLTNVNVLAGSITGQTFGTLTSTITPPTTFTADKGPVAYIY